MQAYKVTSHWLFLFSLMAFVVLLVPAPRTFEFLKPAIWVLCTAIFYLQNAQPHRLYYSSSVTQNQYDNIPPPTNKIVPNFDFKN
jgi:hypothetical protein